MRCVLCGRKEALNYSVICVDCSLKLRGKSPMKFARMRGILDLMNSGWMTTNDVAARTGMSRNTVKRYLNNLLRYGLVERKMALRVNGRTFPRWTMVWRKVN